MKIVDMNAQQLEDRLHEALNELDEAINYAKNYGSARLLHILALRAEHAAKITAEMEQRGLLAPLDPGDN